jgi:beta-glucanase (GH16 family)
MRVSILAVVLCVLAAGCGASTPAPAPRPASWAEIWQDDFTGSAGSPPSASNWLHDTGTCYPGCPAAQWGTGEIETMTDSPRNVSLDGSGHLAITPVNINGQWTSGRIETRRTDFRPPPGGVLRVEASIRQPELSSDEGAGYWSAFWLLGDSIRTASTGWPGAGEVDVMEAVNGHDTAFGTLHCGTYPQGPCNEPQGLGSAQTPCAACGQRFHTYASEIDYSVTPHEAR